MDTELLPARLAAVLVAGASLIPSSVASTEQPAAAPREQREAALAATVDHARHLFDEAGLALPALDLEHHGEDADRCGGGVGLHHVVGGTHAIELCGERVSVVTVLHEMAHAWVAANVSLEQRATFRQLRGWAYWRDYERAAWHDNGTEQAAEIIVWGVADRVLPMVRIEQNSCEELTAGYLVLTGRRPDLVDGHPCTGASGVAKVDLTASQRVAVGTAIEWYAEMGFELPPVIVRGGGRDTLCKGHSGLYVWGAGVPEVRICTTGGAWEQRVVLHELAHAWSYEQMPAPRRDDFVALRGLDAWHDVDDPWELRGDEHAAEIIAWGVSETPFSVMRISGRTCTELRAGFVALTGVEPRAVDGPRCRPRTDAPDAR
jgi:hypothetical protein